MAKTSKMAKYEADLAKYKKDFAAYAALAEAESKKKQDGYLSEPRSQSLNLNQNQMQYEQLIHLYINMGSRNWMLWAKIMGDFANKSW